LRRQRRLAGALAEQAQQPPQLRHGLPPAQLDRLERFRGGLLARRQHPALGRGLHDDDAQAVCDNVVQLPGDPGPLGRDGAGCPALQVPLEPFRPVPLARSTLPVLVHDPAHDESKGKEQQRGKHVADALAAQLASYLASAEYPRGDRGARPQQPAIRAASQGKQGDKDRQGRLEWRLVLGLEHGQDPDTGTDSDQDDDRCRRPETSAERNRDQQQEPCVDGDRPVKGCVVSFGRQAAVLRYVGCAQGNDGQRD
jgi:hypothetical protein